MDMLTPAERRKIENARGAMRRTQQHVQQQVDTLGREFVAARLIEVAEYMPGAPQALMEAYAMTPGLSLEEVGELAMKWQSQDVSETSAEGFFGKLGNALHGVWFGIYDQVVKPAVRGGILAVDTVAQEALQRPGTAAILSATDPELGFGEAYEQYGPSTGVQAATDVAQGRGLDLGEVLIPGGDAFERGPGSRELVVREGNEPTPYGTFGQAIVEGQDRVYGAVGEALGIKGLNRATPAVAAGFLIDSIQSPNKGWDYAQEVVGGDDPGQHAFEKASGFYQFTAEVALDPTMWGVRGAAHSIRKSKGLLDGGHRSLGSAMRATSPDMAKTAREAATHGAVSGRRNTAIAEVVEDSLFKNRKLLDMLAESDSYDLYRNLRLDRIQHRGDNLAKFVDELGDMKNPDDIAEFLLRQVEDGYVRERGFYQGVGKYNAVNPRQWWRSKQGDGWVQGTETRYGGLNPEQMISVKDPLHAAGTLDNWMRLGKVPVETRRELFKEALHADSNAKLLHTMGRAVEGMGDRLAKKSGFNPESFGKLAQAHIDEVERTTRTYARVGKENLGTPWAKSTDLVDVPMPGGEILKVPYPSAGMIVDGMQSAVPLPSAQAIRRATSDWETARKLYDSNGWGAFEQMTRFTTARLFKPLALFTRLSYTVRNNIDNNLRMAGAGYSSMFTPDGYFAALNTNKRAMSDLVFDTGNKSLDANVLAKLKDGRYAKIDSIAPGASAADDVLFFTARNPATGKSQVLHHTRRELEELTESTARVATESFKDLKVLTDTASGMHFSQSKTQQHMNSFRFFEKGTDKQYTIAWQDEIIRMHSDPIYVRAMDPKFATRGELVDEIVDKKLHQVLADTLGEEAKQFFFPNGQFKRARIDKYLDEYVMPHIKEVTGNSDELRHAIATGKLGDGTRLTDDLVRERLAGQLFEHGPRDVRGSAFLGVSKDEKTMWEQTIGFLAEWTASRPENHFTRYPLMTQVWADDIGRSMKSLANDDLRQEVIERAIAANMPKKQVEQLRRAAASARGRTGNIDDLDGMLQATKMHAADKTREIAFDATARGSFQEAFDAWAPFYDAWAEVATSWGRIVRDNPNVFVRGTNTFRALQGSGTFFTDEFGNEVFQYPGGSVLASILGIESANMVPVGNVMGLNMVVQGIGPGVGPVVQWPAAAMIPANEEWQWLRDFVLPFGSDIHGVGDLADVRQYVSDLVPAWAEKAINAATEGGWDEHQWNTMVGHAMTAIGTAESHRYDFESEEGMAEFVKDAHSTARWAMTFRSFLQWGMPTGPRIEWEVETDPDGTFHRINSLASEYFDLLEEVGGDEQLALSMFVEANGIEPYWIAQGASRQIVQGPRSREGQHWLQRQEKVQEKYPDVMGYFVPDELADAPPDYGVLRERIKKGEVQSLTPQQQMQLVRMNQAYSILNAQKQRIAHLTPGEQDAIMGQVRGYLHEKFPGWNAGISGLAERRSRDYRIIQLEKAVDDPLLADVALTEPLSLYLQKRRQAFDAIETRGGAAGITAQSNEDIRQWLHQVGQAISLRYPEFRGTWTSLLSREVDE